MTKKQFRDALSQLGMTQGQAAEEIGYSLKMINNYYCGREPVPRVVELAIAYLLLKAK